MTNSRERFFTELNRLLLDPKVKRMKEFPQHFGTNTLSHSIKVAEASFRLAEKLGWDIDERELARGALLHDYYLFWSDAQRTQYYPGAYVASDPVFPAPLKRGGPGLHGGQICGFKGDDSQEILRGNKDRKQ